ncbi:hypothetical protein, partial [Nocardia gipuzkoensis]|uniref:hypothetical protein n=1 Tax=Nocardia gipuzkoensis TaxID=2749991 RepID=UPI002456F348
MPTTRCADLVPATEHIVRHLLDIIPRRHVTSGNLLREEIRATVANCLDLVAGGGAPPPGRARARGGGGRPGGGGGGGGGGRAPPAAAGEGGG